MIIDSYKLLSVMLEYDSTIKQEDIIPTNLHAEYKDNCKIETLIYDKKAMHRQLYNIINYANKEDMTSRVQKQYLSIFYNFCEEYPEVLI